MDSCFGLPRETCPDLLSLVGRFEKIALTAGELHEARQNVNTNPSEAQKESGNYAKGHVEWKGFRLAIENPKGSTRSGKDKSGKEWSIQMKHDYGYFKGIRGADKDHLDVFIGPHLDCELVHIVDQVDPDSGKFDEHKVIVGAQSADEARKIYLANYSDDWQGFGSIKAYTVPGFRHWVAKGDLFEPADEKVIKTPVPFHRQGTNWTCGPASLDAVNEALGGKETTEQEISKATGATPEAGTTPEALAAEAKELGLGVKIHERMSLDDLTGCLDNDHPVIIDIQAWGDPAEYAKLEDGHYVVAVGYDEENIYFEDPSIEENMGKIPRDELIARWADKENNGKTHIRLGIELWKDGVVLPDQELETAEKVAMKMPGPLGSPLHPINPNSPFNENLQAFGERIYAIVKARQRMMNWRRRKGGKRRKKRAAEEKWATVYQFTGDVQSTGLRKNLHRLLDEYGVPGVAYNDARQGYVLATIDAEEEKRKEILEKLRAIQTAKEKVKSWDYVELPKKERLRPVTLAPKDVVRMAKRQGFTEMMAQDPTGEGPSRDWIAERYRLTPDESGNLTGWASKLADRQLRGLEPIYSGQVTGLRKNLKTGYGPAYWDRKPKSTFGKTAEDICSICKEPWSRCLGRHGSKPCPCGSGKPRNRCDCPGGTPDSD